jgi:diguanylate cyclase (GGDEF)-like protein
MRKADTCARMGGEEFCVLLPGASSDAAAVIAERVRVAVEAVSVPGEDQLPTGRLTVSVGVADATEPDAAIRAADRALYAAKAAGRNRVVTAGAPAV